MRIGDRAVARAVHWGVLIAISLAGGPGRSESESDGELARIRRDYEYGKYANVLEEVRERMQYGNLSDDQVVELHKFAGLSAFNLGETGQAERDFTALLHLNPDYELDPFAVPPPAIAFYQSIRQRLGKELEGYRQIRQAKIERQKLEADRREAERRNQEERRRIEALAGQVAPRPEKPSFLLNFIPFGAGQFQQGRSGMGVFLAVSQAAAAATSIIAFVAYDSLRSTRTIELDSVLAPTLPFNVLEEGIPRSRAREANSWRAIKYSAGGLFYALYAFGVIDALIHHEGPPKTAIPPAKPRASSSPARPWDGAQPFVFATPGGAGAGLRIRF